MTNEQKELLYLQNLYLDAGRNIKDKLYYTYSRYIDFGLIDNITANIIDTTDLVICDYIGAFFNELCLMIIEPLPYAKTIYITISPYYNFDVIWSVTIPEHSINIINIYSSENNYENIGYTISLSKKTIKQLSISQKMIDKI